MVAGISPSCPEFKGSTSPRKSVGKTFFGSFDFYERRQTISRAANANETLGIVVGGNVVGGEDFGDADGDEDDIRGKDSFVLSPLNSLYRGSFFKYLIAGSKKAAGGNAFKNRHVGVHVEDQMPEDVGKTSVEGQVGESGAWKEGHWVLTGDAEVDERCAEVELTSEKLLPSSPFSVLDFPLLTAIREEGGPSPDDDSDSTPSSNSSDVESYNEDEASHSALDLTECLQDLVLASDEATGKGISGSSHANNETYLPSLEAASSAADWYSTSSSLSSSFSSSCSLTSVLSPSESEPICLVPAIKGTKPKAKGLHISWAPDVIDPPPSLVSHSKSSHNVKNNSQSYKSRRKYAHSSQHSHSHGHSKKKGAEGSKKGGKNHSRSHNGRSSSSGKGSTHEKLKHVDDNVPTAYKTGHEDFPAANGVNDSGDWPGVGKLEGEGGVEEDAFGPIYGTKSLHEETAAGEAVAAVVDFDAAKWNAVHPKRGGKIGKLAKVLGADSNFAEAVVVAGVDEE
eukprot:TRINITY_DN1381_c0_g1_i3.p1 TRINITY_DN1381_c0_g1~~TRINITY_DN1381_c0_g1_i3.p1  ORF type:complete len:511 (-),score=89.25 TRINITY_DN1381_c0_g1_i3:338-1870(-)